MQLLSAHAAIGLAIAVFVALLLLVLQVPPVIALAAAGLIGWLLVQTVLRDTADRAERWLTTPK